MGVLSGLKGLVYKADFFYTSQLLRYKEEPEYRTLLGGFLSLSIIIALTVTFYNKVVDTLDMIIITSSSAATNADDPTPFFINTIPSGPFMLGVEIWHHNLNEGERYFDVVLTNVVYATGDPQPDKSLEVALEPCTVDHWVGYPKIQADFERLQIGFWLCLPRNASFEVKGKYASVESKTLQVAVRACTNRSSEARACAEQSVIDQFMADNGNFYFTAYFLNPLINADQQNYLTYYLEDSNYILFSTTDGEEAQIHIEDFTIETDESILPYSQIKTDSGGIVARNALKNRYTVGPSYPTYCTFFFFKSPTSRNITRSFQKIDEVLSYLGGLFGTIAIALFIVNVYNSYSFELTLGGVLYQAEGEEGDAGNLHYNFFYFLAQLAYSLLRHFKCPPKWPRVKQYYDCREEMLQQLDILYLLQRITHLEKTITLLLEQPQLQAAHLLPKLTLHQAKEARITHRLKDSLLKQKEGEGEASKGEEDKGKKDRGKGVKEKKNENLMGGSIQELNIGKSGLNNFSYNFNQEEFEQSSHKVVEDGDKEEESETSSHSHHAEPSPTLLQSLQWLRNTKHNNPISKRIWERIDRQFRDLISNFSDNLPDNDSGFGQQPVSLSNSLQGNRIELPKIYRQAAGKIILNKGRMEHSGKG